MDDQRELDLKKPMDGYDMQWHFVQVHTGRNNSPLLARLDRFRISDRDSMRSNVIVNRVRRRTGCFERPLKVEGLTRLPTEDLDGRDLSE